MSTLLREIKEHFGGRLSKCQFYDTNVCNAKWPAEKPWEIELVSGEPFLQELRFSCRNYSVNIYANASWVSVTVKGGFEAGVFSLNAWKQLGFKSTPAGNHRFTHAEFPVFTQDGELSLEQIKLLTLPELEELAQEIQPNSFGIIRFSRDEVEIYLHEPVIEQVERVVNKLVDLASKFATEA